jgi:Ubiquitin-like modifier-activating enzyme ATG7 N-terminus
MDLIKTRPLEVLHYPAFLVPFHILCYANLKKYVFDYHVSIPVLSTKWNILNSEKADPILIKAVEEYIALAPVEQRGFFIATGSQESEWTIYPLSKLQNDTTSVSPLSGS